MKQILASGIAALAIIAVPTMAQENSAETAAQPAPNQPPRCDDEAYRAFDFWIGEWEVRTPDGQLAGHNSIEAIANDCGLTETYTQRGNPAGQSLNYYDEARRTWGQTWVSPGIVILMEGASPAAGVMQMSGTIAYRNQPFTRPFSGRWTLQPDGTVKQQFWEQAPDTGDWSDWFTGIYTKVGE